MSYTVEPKMDGLAIELMYEKGILTVRPPGATVIVGEDVTQNLRTIK